MYIDRGDVEEGLALGREALAVAPEPLSRAASQGHLGYAHLEGGDTAAAIPLLRTAAETLAGFGQPALSGRCTCSARRTSGPGGRARRGHSCSTGSSAWSRTGTGWASRADRERADPLARQALAFFTEAKALRWEARARALVESLDGERPARPH